MNEAKDTSRGIQRAKDGFPASAKDINAFNRKPKEYTRIFPEKNYTRLSTVRPEKKADQKSPSSAQIIAKFEELFSAQGVLSPTEKEIKNVLRIKSEYKKGDKTGTYDGRDFMIEHAINALED